MPATRRRMHAIAEVRRAGRITNSEYQKLAGVIRKTATRDLDDLVTRGVLARVGEKRGSHYVRSHGNEPFLGHMTRRPE